MSEQESASGHSIELAPDYYRNNFLRLIKHALSCYEDLLEANEREWIDAFLSLSNPAQCLLIRFLTRKGEWFRSDKLTYPEIGSIAEAATELEAAAFIEVNPPVSRHELALALLTKPEIVASFEVSNTGQRKEALIAQLSTAVSVDPEEFSFDYYHLCQPEIISLLSLLFFANTHQDLSQFVLDDLGLHQFEAYPLSRELRFFNRRQEVNTLLELSRINHDFELLSAKENDELLRVTACLPERAGHEYIKRKLDQFVNRVARELERRELYEPALNLYRKTSIPPSRERQVRIFDKLNRDLEAENLVSEMLSEPENREEEEMALRLSARLRRKRGEKVPRATKPVIDELCLNLDLSKQRVEPAVRQHFESEGWHCFYLENQFLNGLFGLAFWDIVFAPVEGAFVNAYQYKPIDLYRKEFVVKREQEITRRLREIRNGQNEIMLRAFRDKKNLSNPFVHWDLFSEEILELAMGSFSGELLAQLFEVMLSDLSVYRAGMPDLIAFKEGRFLWIEVKGPGDKLQDNQWRWIREFRRLNVPFTVCYVNRE